MSNPTDAEAVRAKIDNGEVKVQGKQRKRKAKATTPATETPATTETAATETKATHKNGELAKEMLALLETLRANGVTETTSPVVRDKLGLDKETGRDTVRRVMRKLAKEGKVVIGEVQHGQKKSYTFSLPNPPKTEEQPAA